MTQPNLGLSNTELKKLKKSFDFFQTHATLKNEIEISLCHPPKSGNSPGRGDHKGFQPLIMNSPTNIINNALEIINEMQPIFRRNRSNNIRKLDSLEIGQGFTVKRHKVSGLRSAAKRREMKITAHEVDPGVFLVCRTF